MPNWVFYIVLLYLTCSNNEHMGVMLSIKLRQPQIEDVIHQKNGKLLV